MSKIGYFASESVCAGHPDKICDQISDAILDAALAIDPDSRVAIEAVAGKNFLNIAGEMHSRAHLDFKKIAREQIKRLGYTEPKWGFSYKSPITVNVHEQSPEIARGVVHDGAGDQGMMFGYANRDSEELMPLPIMLAHRLTRGLDLARESGLLPYLRPDGKAQVVVKYRDEKPVSVEHVTIAAPHTEAVALNKVKSDIYETVILPALKDYGYAIPIRGVVVNGTGVWHHPGPAQDTGLTGRKIIVDSYGGYARVGGGAFSGKDASKLDRSGAYAARYLAKNIVAHKLAEEAEVGLAYYIGGKKPVMLEIDTFGTGKVSQKKLTDFANSLLDVSVQGIIKGLDLRRPIYLPTAAYGHFGRPEFPWELVVTR
jgi:S-adenosylmethionine synthetase